MHDCRSIIETKHLFAEGEVNLGEYSSRFTELDANNCFNIVLEVNVKTYKVKNQNTETADTSASLHTDINQFN